MLQILRRQSPAQLHGERMLKLPSARDQRRSLFRADQCGLPPVARHLAPLEIPVRHQPVHVKRHDARLQALVAADVLRRVIARIVRQIQDDVQRRGRQLCLRTQRLHHRMVRVEKARRVYKHLRSGPCQLRHTASSDLK